MSGDSTIYTNRPGIALPIVMRLGGMNVDLGKTTTLPELGLTIIAGGGLAGPAKKFMAFV